MLIDSGLVTRTRATGVSPYPPLPREQARHRPAPRQERPPSSTSYALEASPPMTTDTVQPYAASADIYLARGWSSVLPLPANSKTPPPGGFTGNGGVTPTATDIATWKRTGGNIALRLPENVLGIDVDDYAAKVGADSLSATEVRWGELPATVMSTSRESGVSGIRLFTIPTGLQWPNVVAPDIDVVRFAHRYAVVAPSLHPEGRPYRWVNTADGTPAEIPCAADLPALPASWVEGLTGGATATVRGKVASPSEVEAFLLNLPEGEAPEDVRTALRTYEADLFGGGRRHDAVLLVTEALAVAGAGGALGVPEALAMARAGIVAEKGERDGGAEFDRAFAGTVARLRDGVLDVVAHGSRLRFVYTPEGTVAADEFWDSRPTLRHVHDFARARMASPWAVLGVVLARVVAATPPSIVLPPLVGSEASLNLFVALVGPSGSGKGAAERAAADAVDVGDLETATVGSGEGIGHLYAHRDKGEIVRDREAVLFTIPEVDNLTALGNRQGATLMPQLRSAWSGEKLGFSYADKSKALPIESHTYRMGLVLGVQPGRAEPLLEDADGGTPQRFVWMPTTDPSAPEVTPSASVPIPWTFGRRRFVLNSRGLHVLQVPEVAERTVRDNRLAALRGETVKLDGHVQLARLKIAAALMLLDQRGEMTEDDWHLAGTIMAVSEETREGVVQYLGQRNRASNEARAQAEGVRAVVVETTVETAKVQRVAQVVKRALAKKPEGEWATRRDITATAASRDRAYLDGALDALVTAGEVETDETGDKPLYRLRTT